jgi:dolichol-phosphate mannosyltransferase
MTTSHQDAPCAAQRQHHPSRGHCLVIIPTYNEAANIEPLMAAILAQGPQFDVLVVDDNSPDGTGERVAALAARCPRVQLLARPGKLGLGTAYIAGFTRGLEQHYQYLCEMDADFSHQPHYLPALLRAAEREADVVLGSRNVPGGRVEQWSALRKLISRGGSLYARLILGLPVRDCTGGFKCFRASALRRLDFASVRSSGYAFQVEMNYRCFQAGLRIKEIPIVFPNRVAGRSKMSQRIVLEAALMVLRMRLGPNPFAGATPREHLADG